MAIAVQHDATWGKYFFNALGIVGGVQRVALINELDVEKPSDKDARGTQE